MRLVYIICAVMTFIAVHQYMAMDDSFESLEKEIARTQELVKYSRL